jgi:predicted TIM-barrel fold metal-dependent hydrolase
MAKHVSKIEDGFALKRQRVRSECRRMPTQAIRSALFLTILLPIVAGAQKLPSNDYHQHLLSPAVASLIGEPRTFLARDLIAQMDAIGIRRAVVLSLAYQFGNPNRPRVKDEYTLVKAENDWTASQVKQYRDRLLGFCGVDPLRDYALSEIERCSHNPYLKFGLKLHFGNSDVDLDNPQHVEKLRQAFHAADSHHMAIVVHMHANVNHHRPYGRKEAEIFLTQVLPSAPHSTIQIAHLAGSGGYDDPATDAALTVFLQAISYHDKRVTHVYFDISGVAGIGAWESKKEQIASRIRQVGVHRILFGSDGAWSGFTPAKAVAAFDVLPLTDQEFRIIRANTPSYMTSFAAR